ASVRRIKGSCRPVVNEKERAGVIAALESVDYVLLFNGDTPLSVIKTLNPDILVKGADWAPEEIVGADYVRRYGGRVATVKLVKGCSTTNLIRRIVKTYATRKSDC
ncbi:MAG: bifunctional heptose 7-phosphate kinase/heptose 1-phosphate adenyltransferase, partial [Deltaproteobacteria bacterium]